MENHSSHELHYSGHSTSDGYYIAKCHEFPSVIVQVKTKEQAEEELITAMKGYLLAFPEEHDTLKTENEPQRILIEI